MNDKKHLEIRADNCFATAVALQYALKKALVIIGDSRPNDGWKEDFYDDCMQYIETMSTASAYGPEHQRPDTESLLGYDAKKAACDLITQTFDLVSYHQKK